MNDVWTTVIVGLEKNVWIQGTFRILDPWDQVIDILGWGIVRRERW